MRRHPIILLLAIFASLVAGDLLALETELTKPPMPVMPDDYWARLKRGEVVVMQQIIEEEREKSYIDLVELIMIEAPVEETFKIVDNCTGFSDYQPNVDRILLLDGAGDESRVYAKLWKFELSAFFVGISYHIITMSDRRSAVVEFTLNHNMENDVARSEGHWWLYPIDGGDKTLIVYALRAESGIPLPRFIEKYAAENALRDILINTRHRVHSGGTWVRGDAPPPFSIFGKSELGNGDTP